MEDFSPFQLMGIQSKDFTKKSFITQLHRLLLSSVLQVFQALLFRLLEVFDTKWNLIGIFHSTRQNGKVSTNEVVRFGISMAVSD